MTRLARGLGAPTRRDLVSLGVAIWVRRRYEPDPPRAFLSPVNPRFVVLPIRREDLESSPEIRRFGWLDVRSPNMQQIPRTRR